DRRHAEGERDEVQEQDDARQRQRRREEGAQLLGLSGAGHAAASIPKLAGGRPRALGWRGGGRSMARSIIVAAAALRPAGGAARRAGASLVATRAASDLSCPEKEIKVESREMGGYEAHGCGRHMSYVVRAGEVIPDSGEDLGPMPSH